MTPKKTTDIIAIDGPVGVGKSSVAAMLAHRLGRQHLDTGAMYRAVALKAIDNSIDLGDENGCARLAEGMDFQFEASGDGQRILLDGHDISQRIRSTEVTSAVSAVADHPAVRTELGRRQKELAEARPSIAEGRDMGSVVFPRARWKFYLDADPTVRAGRRGNQLSEKGENPTHKDLLASIADRDRRDRERPVGALTVAKGAMIIDTTGMDLERVVTVIEQIVGGEAKDS